MNPKEEFYRLNEEFLDLNDQIVADPDNKDLERKSKRLLKKMLKVRQEFDKS